MSASGGAVTFHAFRLVAWRDDQRAPNITWTLAEAAMEALSRSCDDLTRQGLMDAPESMKRPPPSAREPGSNKA